MSRAAKGTLIASVVLSGLTVWGVHYMQVQERESMYRGVERDIARLADKAKQRERALEHEENKRREVEFQKIQPTKSWIDRSGDAKGDR